MFKFNWIFIAAFLTIVYSDFAEPFLKVYSINTTSYPRLTARFILTDEDNKQVNLKPDDFDLYENDIKQRISGITCPEIKSDIPVSLVICIDVSKSMDVIDSVNQLPRIEYAKQTAIEVIKALKNPDSEIALIFCNDSAKLMSGFTTDKTSLFNLINSIKTSGKFSATASVYDPDNGLLAVSKKGKYRRGALAITPQYENQLKRFETQLVFNENKITFFVVFTNRTVPPVQGVIIPFAYLAIHTGGYYIDSIYASVKINPSMIQRIVYPLQMLNPCELEWISRGVCEPNRRFLMINWKFRVDTRLNFYNPIDETKLPRLEFQSPDFVDFGSVQPGSTGIIKIDIMAKSGDVVLDTITTSNPVFRITDYGGSNPPFEIPQNTKRTLTIQFSPQDSMLYFGGFNIINNGCSNVILSLKGGAVRKSHFPNTLHLERPNGGETLVAGSKFMTIWNGVHLSDTVCLDYSVDAGNNWYPITKSATNFEYTWKVVNIESDKCLMRTYQPPTSSIATLRNHLNSVTVAKWSPDAKYIASGGADSNLIIWNASDGSIVKIFKRLKNIGRISSIGWRPDSKYLAASGDGNNFILIDMNNFDNYKFVFADQGDGIVNVSWSPNAVYIMTAAASEGTIKLWTADKLKNIKTIFSGTEDLTSVSWSPNCMELAVSNSRATNIFSVPLGDLYKSFSGPPTSPFLNARIDLSSDNQILAIGNFVKMLIVQNDSGIVNLPDLPLGSVKCVAVSPDNKKIAVAASSMRIYIYDIAQKKIVKTYFGHKNAVNHISYSPDGSYFVTSSADSTLKVWETGDSVIQNDVSDSLWKIILPNATAHNIDFGKIPIGSFSDTLITEFITNTGTVPINIDTMKLDGEQSPRFKILDGLPPYLIIEGDSKPLKMRFTPKDTGIVKVVLKIYTQNDTLFYNVSGEGISSPLKAVNDVIDFGKVFLDSVKVKYVAAIKNLTQTAVTITSTEILGGNKSQFHILDGGGSFTLYPNSENHFISISFNPKFIGKISDSLAFNFEGIGSPTIIKLFGEGTKECDSAGFIYNDFSDISHLNILEDARGSGQSIVLTECKAMNRGAVWYNRLVPVKNGFECEFRLRLSGGTNNKTNDGSSPGGDGFAFVLQAYHPFIIGMYGGGLGYESIPNSLAIEFDTFANDSTQIENYNDPNGNHVAVQTNLSNPNTAKHGSPQTLAINSNILPLIADSSHIYNIKINYNSKDSSLYVFTDTLNYFGDPVLKLHPFVIQDEINLVQGNSIFIGITAATGYAWERHDLLSWSLCPGNIRLTDVGTSGQTKVKNGNLKIYPNPTDGFTSISFDVISNSNVSLRILDILGNEVTNLLNETMTPGHYEINYDSKMTASGIYYCIIKIGDYREIKELVLVR